MNELDNVSYHLAQLKDLLLFLRLRCAFSNKACNIFSENPHFHGFTENPVEYGMKECCEIVLSSLSEEIIKDL